MYYIEQINLLTIIGENILRSLELGMKIIKTNKQTKNRTYMKTLKHGGTSKKTWNLEKYHVSEWRCLVMEICQFSPKLITHLCYCNKNP